MGKTEHVFAEDPASWKQLVKAAIFATNSGDLRERIQDAQDAVMDRIEDSFQTASQAERQSLINAMNSLRELRCLVRRPASESEAKAKNLTDA